MSGFRLKTTEEKLSYYLYFLSGCCLDDDLGERELRDELIILSSELLKAPLSDALISSFKQAVSDFDKYSCVPRDLWQGYLLCESAIPADCRPEVRWRKEGPKIETKRQFFNAGFRFLAQGAYARVWLRESDPGFVFKEYLYQVCEGDNAVRDARLLADESLDSTPVRFRVDGYDKHFLRIPFVSHIVSDEALAQAVIDRYLAGRLPLDASGHNAGSLEEAGPVKFFDVGMMVSVPKERGDRSASPVSNYIWRGGILDKFRFEDYFKSWMKISSKPPNFETVRDKMKTTQAVESLMYLSLVFGHDYVVNELKICLTVSFLQRLHLVWVLPKCRGRQKLPSLVEALDDIVLENISHERSGIWLVRDGDLREFISNIFINFLGKDCLRARPNAVLGALLAYEKADIASAISGENKVLACARLQLMLLVRLAMPTDTESSAYLCLSITLNFLKNVNMKKPRLIFHFQQVSKIVKLKSDSSILTRSLIGGLDKLGRTLGCAVEEADSTTRFVSLAFASGRHRQSTSPIVVPSSSRGAAVGAGAGGWAGS